MRLQPFSATLAVSLETVPRLWLTDEPGHWREATAAEWSTLQHGAKMEALNFFAAIGGPVGKWAKVQAMMEGLRLIVDLVEHPEIVSEAGEQISETMRFLRLVIDNRT